MTSTTHDTPPPQPIDLSVRQRAASEVKRSFALSAGAGAGKTSVLVDRIVRLLLSGIPAENIAAIIGNQTPIQWQPRSDKATGTGDWPPATLRHSDEVWYCSCVIGPPDGIKTCSK